MKLYTECHWDDWDRIVDVYPERCEELPDYINDDSTYKIIILEKGILQLESNGDSCEAKAPALIMLSDKDRLSCRIMQNMKAELLFFKPSVIRDEFTLERIDSGEFEETVGQVIYQDYILIKFFKEFEKLSRRVISLPMNGFRHLKELYISAEKELKGQRDGFWPCRSRSYLMELLYYIVYSFVEARAGDDDPEESGQSQFSEIADYLNEHIEEPITLETLTKEFMINRNKLNDLFMKQSSMTCMNYLLKLRIDLAKILLTKTELPIGEISARVGYPDPNYFAKVFKNNVGKTPTGYRKS